MLSFASHPPVPSFMVAPVTKVGVAYEAEWDVTMSSSRKRKEPVCVCVRARPDVGLSGCIASAAGLFIFSTS
jgi:hypothetical protein